ncbi:hypothetical protein N1851_013353 [Merluccius polli]|uniref:Uncharacterized protein n=1 Tax=Merluccius polli TaxID=89951 RepID=A0AA47MV56_MERPO|nr:hypothetical protein N1851_013353 [Merluccius polli]
MHDILEGIGPYEVKLVLSALIDQKHLSLEKLNNRITSFDYGFSDRDIRRILSATIQGRAIVQSLDNSNLILTKERRQLVRLLVSHLMETYGETPTADTKKTLASSLVQAFPSLADSSACGSDIWYAMGRKHLPATGFLEERLRNIRKRMRASHRLSKEEDCPCPSPTLLPAPSISQERAEQMVEWLRTNSSPSSQVEDFMSSTAIYRAEWVRKNNSSTIEDVIKEFPRLICPGMIAQDFQIVYREAAPKLFEMWELSFADKVLRLLQKEGKLTVDAASLTQDSKTYMSLRLLPSLMPLPVFRVGKNTSRANMADVKKAFIDVRPVGTNIVEYLREAEVNRPYPFVLVLGGEEVVHQDFNPPQVFFSTARVNSAGAARPVYTDRDSPASTFPRRRVPLEGRRAAALCVLLQTDRSCPPRRLESRLSVLGCCRNMAGSMEEDPLPMLI